MAETLGPAAQVTASFTLAKDYADAAQTSLTNFTDALSGALYTAPSISAEWQTILPPPIPTVGDAPEFSPIIYTPPASGLPAPLTETVPAISIDSFTTPEPSIDVPTAPTLSYGVAPVIPGIGAVSVPDAPTLLLPDAPSYLSLSTITFGGIDIHEDWLSKLENIPELELLSPTPYSYARGPEYASDLLAGLKAVLTERLAGGSGLAPAVEQALWDRARSRETAIAQANQDEIMRSSEALGFQLPAGVLAAQLRTAQQDYYDKLSTLSRDVSIKQAELEQENLKQTIAQGMELEGKLIDYSYKLEQLTFETAKEYANNAIQAHNASVEKYKALLGAYQTYAAAYKTIIDAELTKVEVYKAQLSGEQTKAQVNSTLVQQYKTQIDASMSQVEIYKAQVGGAQTLVQLEQAKIGAAGEQIKAYVAQINGETAKVEAYKAQVQASVAGAEIYKAQAQAYSAKTGAQAEQARAQVSRFTALAQAKAAEWDGYKAQVGAEATRIQALGAEAGAKTESYKARAAAAEAQGNVNARMWEAQMAQYGAQRTYQLSVEKINKDLIMDANNARLEAAKAGAQVYAQLTASAYSMVNASASISGSGSTSVSYSYSNDTSGVGPTTTSA